MLGPDQLKEIGNLMAHMQSDICEAPVPAALSALLADLSEREAMMTQEKIEAASPRPIATDDAPGG